MTCKDTAEPSTPPMNSTAGSFFEDDFMLHAPERLLFRENLSNGLSANVYTLEIYPAAIWYNMQYTTFVAAHVL